VVICKHWSMELRFVLRNIERLPWSLSLEYIRVMTIPNTLAMCSEVTNDPFNSLNVPTGHRIPQDSVTTLKGVILV